MQSNQKAHDKFSLKRTKKPLPSVVCVCVHMHAYMCVWMYTLHTCQLCVLLHICPCMCVCLHCIHVLCVCCLYTHFIHFISLLLHIHDTCHASTCLPMHFFHSISRDVEGTSQEKCVGQKLGGGGVNGGQGCALLLRQSTVNRQFSFHLVLFWYWLLSIMSIMFHPYCYNN